MNLHPSLAPPLGRAIQADHLRRAAHRRAAGDLTGGPLAAARRGASVPLRVLAGRRDDPRPPVLRVVR